VQRLREQRVAPRLFDDAAEVHHRDFVAQVAHHAQVVADEQIGQAEVALQPHHQVQHLRLDGHVQRRHRLVAHHQLGPGRQRARRRRCAALSAGAARAAPPLLSVTCGGPEGSRTELPLRAVADGPA
jgi:hypothetical protein